MKPLRRLIGGVAHFTLIQDPADTVRVRVRVRVRVMLFLT